jgi:hypothetical protein
MKQLVELLQEPIQREKILEFDHESIIDAISLLREELQVTILNELKVDLID